MKPLQTLTRFIYSEQKKFSDTTGELSDLLSSIALAVKVIGQLVATAGFKGLTGYSGQTNVQGEKTFLLDDEADKVLFELLSTSGCFGSIVSEERDEATETVDAVDGAKYVVAFDPLDGSSNVGTNIPVGTIFTIFKKKTSKKANESDFLQPGRKIVASGYSVYGAKTSFVYSCGQGVHGFTLDPDIGEFILTEENITLPGRGTTYSVNEGYTSLWDNKIQELVALLKTNDNPLGCPYSGRYVGSLVADFDRTLRQGGIFLHPANENKPNGKLRLLYECMPLAFIAEQAGGMAVGLDMHPILDREPKTIHDRSPYIAGSKAEIEWATALITKKG